MAVTLLDFLKQLNAGGPGSGRHKGDGAILYHGTTMSRAKQIQQIGLKTTRNSPAVTSDKEYARAAAKLKVEEEGGTPAVIVFKPSASRFFKSDPSGIRQSGTRLIPSQHISKVEDG